MGMIYRRVRGVSVTITAVLALLCAAASARAQTARGASRFDLRPDPCPTARRSHDDSGCNRPRSANQCRRRLRVSRTSRRRLRDLRGTERIRASASCRACAGGRTGRRVLHLARRYRGRNVRHGRKGGRARRSDDSHGDQCRLELPSSGAWERRHWERGRRSRHP